MHSGVLELKSVKAGHVVLKGKSSSLFLCVDSAGHLSGQVQWPQTCPIQKVLIFMCHLADTSHLLSFFQRLYVEADCAFRELLLADGYTRFLSSHHGSPLSLASKQSPDRHAVPFTRFLPLRNTLAVESASDQPPNNQRLFNVDSDDLLGMALNSMISPQFSAEKWRKQREVFI